jgi:hypothetical protein
MVLKRSSPLQKLTLVTLDDKIKEGIKPFAFEGLPAAKVTISGDNLKN